MKTDISYLLYWDDDSIPIDGNMTLGNHLDNDIVVPGEDVSDYHARIDLSDRGPVVIPLGNATVSVNGHEAAAPVRLMIGDVLGIGQATMQIGIEQEGVVEAESWTLGRPRTLEAEFAELEAEDAVNAELEALKRRVANRTSTGGQNQN